jgi:CubicO group peptidase (beta-lactamase class C family)
MKRLHLILLITLISNSLYAQSDNYKIAITNFQSNFNADKYDSIFINFSPEMKNALPLEKANQYFKNLKNKYGKIVSKEFINYQQSTYANYKTEFETAILAVNISLDNQNKINGFFVDSYKDPNKTESKTVNALYNYPKEIADIIFSKSKDFPNNTQLSIAIIINDKTNYYGIIKVNDTIKPAENQNKVFEIGSITKVFTSTVLASLVIDKKLNLTDNINTFYPFPFKDNVELSFVNLANHTSGLPKLPKNLDLSNGTNPYKNFGEKEIETFLKDLLKLDNEPSKTYSYSNLGAGLLGYTLGLSQKSSFQNLLQKKIFNKYKMTSSFTSSHGLDNRLVKGLNQKGETVSNWDFDVLFGGGGILSTTEDLVKFANAQFNPKNKDLDLTRISTFKINESMRIGLGWHIITTKNGKDIYWHNGGTGGYSSSMAVKIDDKTVVIILANVSNVNDKIDGICFELINKN